MNVLDLFSGIGGFSLGLERAGMRTVAFCEIDPYCQAVLRKHWPDVPVFGDVRELTAEALFTPNTMCVGCEPRSCWDLEHEPVQPAQYRARQRQDAGWYETLGSQSRAVDVICGGFPCQDISVAGKGAGIEGSRSGLWSEYARIVGEVRPRYVIVENVAALLGRGLGRVLGDLAALGYDAEWHCIPACAVGAPHRRDRVWIVAYAPERGQRTNGRAPRQARHSNLGSEAMAHTDQPRLEGWLRTELRERADERATGAGGSQWDEQRWFAESGMGRVAHGVPVRVDRLRSLGNAVVPQIPELIGRAIMKVANADVR